MRGLQTVMNLSISIILISLSNDIETNPGPTCNSSIPSPNVRELKISPLNTRSILPKIDTLRLEMKDKLATNPGPLQNSTGYNIQCLYLNARSLINKTNELQTLAIDIDLLAITETWLKPDNLNSEILSSNNFNIYRRVGLIKPVEVFY